MRDAHWVPEPARVTGQAQLDDDKVHDRGLGRGRLDGLADRAAGHLGERRANR